MTGIQNEELWQFPIAQYPLKVMGESRYPMAQLVADILGRHVPGFDPATLEMVASSKGTWVSVRAVFPATSKEQINAIYAELAAEPRIRTAL